MGYEPYESEFETGFHSGCDLTDSAASELEAKLAHDPNDLNARAQLLGFHSKKEWDSDEPNEKRIEHVLWAIENVPDHGLGRTPYLWISKEHFPQAHEQAGRLIAAQCAKYWSDPSILFEFGCFYHIYNPADAERILRRAHEISIDKSQTAFRLSVVLRQVGTSTGNTDKLADAIALMQESAAKSEGDFSRSIRLYNLAKLAFDAGRFELAQETSQTLLAMVNSLEQRHQGDKIHVAHTVLGRLALQAGDLDEAKEQLLASCQVTRSSRISSYGPLMALAQELLNRGERECVAEYLEGCRSFWRDKHGKLDAWITAIRAGDTPTLEADKW